MKFTKVIYRITSEALNSVSLDYTKEDIQNAIYDGGEFSTEVEVFETKAEAVKVFNRNYKFVEMNKTRYEYDLTCYFLSKITLEFEVDLTKETFIKEVTVINSEELMSSTCPRI